MFMAYWAALNYQCSIMAKIIRFAAPGDSQRESLKSIVPTELGRFLKATANRVQLDPVLGSRTSVCFSVQTGEGGSIVLRAGEG